MLRSHRMIVQTLDDGTLVASVTLMCLLGHSACTDGSTASALCIVLLNACDRSHPSVGGHSQSSMPRIIGPAPPLATPRRTSQIVHIPHSPSSPFVQKHSKSFTALTTRCTECFSTSFSSYCCSSFWPTCSSPSSTIFVQTTLFWTIRRMASSLLTKRPSPGPSRWSTSCCRSFSSSSHRRQLSLKQRFFNKQTGGSTSIDQAAIF